MATEYLVPSKINIVSYKIAVIEDDEAIGLMYQYKLESSGYNVTRVRNGAEGLTMGKDFKPDLILLDLLMPVMNGDEMLEKMRATEWGARPRVVILTNISKDEAPMRLRFLNVDRYVVKAHHTPQQIADIIKEVLNEGVAKEKSVA